MIITLVSLTRKEYFAEVAEYFKAWGIPTGPNGRTDGNTMVCSNSNPNYIGEIPDNKILVRTSKILNREELTMLLHKDACDNIFSFDIILKNGIHMFGSAKFLDEVSIDIHIVNDNIINLLSSIK